MGQNPVNTGVKKKELWALFCAVYSTPWALVTCGTASSAPSSASTPPAPPSSSSSPSSIPPPSRRFPSPCWTHEETLALIESYQEKWHSLRRSNLRASHWDDVAGSLSCRSLHLPASTPKTSVQCRHKVEKLRKHYRAEKNRSPSFPPTSNWVYFPKMAAMEHGTDPSSAPPPSDDDDDDGNDFAGVGNFMANGGGGGGIGGLKFQIPKAARSRVAESRDEERRSQPQQCLGFRWVEAVGRGDQEEIGEEEGDEEEEGGGGGDGDCTAQLLRLQPRIPGWKERATARVDKVFDEMPLLPSCTLPGSSKQPRKWSILWYFYHRNSKMIY